MVDIHKIFSSYNRRNKEIVLTLKMINYALYFVITNEKFHRFR